MSVIVDLKGGMGNQMFMYAMGRENAARLGTDLILDTASFHNYRHPYSLHQWEGVTSPTAVNAGGRIVREKVEGGPYETGTVAEVSDGCRLTGYWLTEKYFPTVSAALRREFVPKQMTERARDLENKIDEHSCFIGVRRGDFVGADTEMKFDYYRDAAASVAAADPAVHFYVFSDESEWVRNNFRLSHPLTVASTHEVYEKDGQEAQDIWLMSRCRHAVLSVSTFSWWGAWLRPNAGETIAPRLWIDLNRNPDVYPAGWRTL